MLAIGKAFDQAAVWLFCAVSSRQWFQGLWVSSRTASESLQARSSQANCFLSSWGWMMKCRPGVSCVDYFPMWQCESTCWQGPGRRRTTIGYMVETGLQRNGSQDLHARLAGMLVTNCRFQKSHCLFFACLFLLRCQMPQALLCTWSMGYYATNMWGSPPMHQSSRYQMFRSSLILDVTSWIARAKRAGPRGSPCCTPVTEPRLKFPWKKDVFEE